MLVFGSGESSNAPQLIRAAAAVSTSRLLLLLAAFCLLVHQVARVRIQPKTLKQVADGESMVLYTLGPLVCISSLITYTDSIAGLARSRLAGSAQWDLSGRYAAFMSHYKTEAAADARHIKDKLFERLGAPIFLDSDGVESNPCTCSEV